MSAMTLKLLLVCATLRHAVGAGAHDHSDEGTPWEWGGIFLTPDGEYQWVSQATKKDADSDSSKLRFVDEKMKAVFLPVADATDATLKTFDEARHAFEIDDSLCETVAKGATIVPAEDKCFMMEFPEGEYSAESPVDAAVTFTFKINTGTTGANTPALAIYTAHVPTEFEYTSHYLMGGTAFDEDVEPEFQTPVSFEWGGIFDVSADTEVHWISQKTSAGEDGTSADYKDPNMQMLIYNMGTKEANIATLSDLHRDYEAEKSEWPACTDVIVTSAAIVPTTLDVDGCFNLIFSSAADSAFKINTDGVSTLAIFTAHGPTEFERDMHYLKKAVPACVDLDDTPDDECDIEAKAEGPPYEIVVVKEYRWGDVIGSSILVNLCTLLGVCIFFLGLSNYVKEHVDVFQVPECSHTSLFLVCSTLHSAWRALLKKPPTEPACLRAQAFCSSFAGGAVLSFTFYLILVEASHYIAAGHPGEDEVEVWHMWPIGRCCCTVDASRRPMQM